MRVDLNAGSAVPENILENSAQSNKPARAGSIEVNKTNEEASRFSTGEAGVSTVASVALNAPEVRQARVETLREQIASGNYAISSHEIAASILEQLRTNRRGEIKQ